MRTPHCSGFSCCRAQALGAQASVVADSVPGEGTKVPQAAGCGHIFCLFSFLEIDICIEMTAESYAAVRNHTEDGSVPFIQLSLTVTACRTHTEGLPWWSSG